MSWLSTFLDFLMGKNKKPNPHLPTPPQLLSATAISLNVVDLTWRDLSTNEQGFRIERCTGGGCKHFVEIGAVGANATFYRDLTAQGTTIYRYQIRAFNSRGSTLSNQVQVTTPGIPPTPSVTPDPPTALVANAGDGEVGLAWVGSVGATSYRVYRKFSGQAYTLIATPVTTTYTDPTLSNGQTYTYKVTAVATGESAASNEASATPTAPTPPAPQPPLAPTGLSAAQGNGQVSLGWLGSLGAASYSLKRGTTSGGETVLQAGLTSLTYVDSTVVNGTRYYYVVTATSPAGTSLASNEVSALPAAPVTPPPPAPSNLVATAGDAQVGLVWGAAAGATSYTVKRGTTSGGETNLATGILVTTYTDSTALNDTQYFYTVVAVGAGGAGPASNEQAATPVHPPTPPPPPPLAAPTGLVVTASVVTNTLNWTASAGAASYRVKRATTSGAETLLASGVTSPRYVDSSGVVGTRYFYIVIAFATPNESAASNEASGVPLPLPAPASLAATPGNARVTLVWSPTIGLASYTYTVKRGTSPGSETTLIAGLTSPLYIDTTAINGQIYYYVVVVVSGANTSPASNEAHATPAVPPVPTAPTLAVAAAGDAQVSLTWSLSPLAVSYTVKRSTSSGTEVAIKTGVTALGYLDTGLTNTTPYFYVVVAVNANGSSPNSNEVTATPTLPSPPPPGQDFGGYREEYPTGVNGEYGTRTRGAWGGAVPPVLLRVTTRNDAGAGSLRAALEGDLPPRVVVVEVSGYLDLSSNLWVTSPYLTVAWQTAPSPGMTIRMVPGASEAMILIATHDVVFQHGRIRPGDSTCNSGIQVYGGNPDQSNIVFDHLSESWAQDEGLNFTYVTHDAMYYECLVAENLSFTPGRETCGGGNQSAGHGIASGFGQNIAGIRCLLAHNRERNFLSDAAGSTYYSNNVIYNPGYGPSWYDFSSSGYPSSSTGRHTAVANYLKRGSTVVGETPAFSVSALQAGCQVYAPLTGPFANVINDGSVPDPFTPFDILNGGIDPRVGSAPNTPPAGYTPMSAADAYIYVLAHAGARPLDRDAVDTRIVSEVQARTGIMAPQTVAQVGGYPALANNSATFTPVANPNAIAPGQIWRPNLLMQLNDLARALEG